MSKNWERSLLLPGFILLFLVSPFFTQPNIGGTGLSLAYNIPAWCTACWLIGIAFFRSISNRQFSAPLLWPFFVAFPAIVIGTSLFAEINQPITWLFRQLYILGGLFFLFSLFQFKNSPKCIDQLLLVIVAATGTQALLGAMQINTPELIPEWIPWSHKPIPSGIFQQINVQATFLSTGIISILYLISRPWLRFGQLHIKVVLVICFALSSYIITASGSRTAVLSLIISLPLIFLSRFKQLRPQKSLLTVLFIVGCIGFFAGTSGLQKTIDKTSQLTEQNYSAARKTMYTIGLELIEKRPFSGYGIGNFLKVWNQQGADFLERYPNANLPEQETQHPHNEILFWMIEGGLLAVGGILIIIIGILLALYRCGFQRGSAYAAMLLPISLHTQVELPFYISSVHWFLWLFLIYLPLSHSVRPVEISLSRMASTLSKATIILMTLGITAFMVNSTRAQADIYSFLYEKNSQPPYLKTALRNLYFKPLAEQIAMRSMLYNSIKKGETEKVKTFIAWAEEYIKTSPELKVYEDLISAHNFLDPKERGCNTVFRALEMYAQNTALQDAYKKCNLEK